MIQPSDNKRSELGIDDMFCCSLFLVAPSDNLTEIFNQLESSGSEA